MRESKLRRLIGAPAFEDELELHRLDCLASHGDLENHAFLAAFRTALDAATAVLLACDIALLVLRYRSLARPMAPLAPRYPAFFRRRGLILASRLALVDILPAGCLRPGK